MKKNGWLLMLFILLGLLTGALAARWLQGVSALSFLSRSTTLELSPAADLYVVSFDLRIGVELSFLSIIGVIVAIWLYRKL